MKKTIISTLLVLFSILQASAQGFTYQGIATEGNDVPIISKPVRFKMSILKNSSSGTSIYNEEQVINTNANGVFSLIVGSVNPTAFDTITWGNGDKYLKVELDITGIGSSFSPMGTTKLQNVPFAYYAKNSAKIQGVSISTTAPSTGQVLTYDGTNWVPKTPTTYTQGTGISIDANNKINTNLKAGAGITIDNTTGTIGISNNFVPAGTVVAFAGDTAQIPTGWLLCNGKYIYKTTYATLYTNIKDIWGTAVGNTFALPDLRGQFLRGAAFNANVDPDYAARTGTNYKIGSKQGDAFQGHTYNGNTVSFTVYGGAVGSTTCRVNGASPVGSPVDDGTNGSPRISSETRPKNVYIHYIIKY